MMSPDYTPGGRAGRHSGGIIREERLPNGHDRRSTVIERHDQDASSEGEFLGKDMAAEPLIGQNEARQPGADALTEDKFFEDMSIVLQYRERSADRNDKVIENRKATDG